MEESIKQTSGTMELLLKKVYSAHKDTIRGVNANLTKYRTAYTKSVEKCHQLERLNNELASENRKLSTVITTRQSRDGSCCEVIRQSLDTVISSYKQMLADKDARINQLEDEVNRLRRSPGITGCEQLLVRSGLTLPKTSPVENVEQNPDSTLCITPKASKQRIDSRQGTTAVDDDLVFDTSPDDGVKLKLNRKRSKRSRYSEDVSPDQKKPRQFSPPAEEVESSDRRKDQNSETCDKQIKDTKVTAKANDKQAERGRNGKKRKDPKILVPDTCVPDLNESLVSKGLYMAGTTAGKESKKRFDTSVLVVPETLAVDMDDTHIPEGYCEETVDRAKDNFKPDLTDITEDTEESNTLRACDDETGTEVDILDKHSKERKVKKKINRKEELAEIPQSFRSLLDSSESEKSEGKKSDSHELDLDSDSLVKDSDDETFFDSLPNSQTFVKSKSKGRIVNDTSIDTDSITRNACKNMKEVDALFETPVSKGCQNETDKDSKDAGTRKPLFKKGKKECLRKEEENEIILRRSPRKHKPSVTCRSPKTPTKVRTKLDKGSNGTNPKSGTDIKRDSGKTKTTAGVLSNDIDNDLTIAPEPSLDRETVGDADNENETLDCYNVMPVKDGNIVVDRKFQLKVKGVRKPNSSKSPNVECDGRTVQIVNINDEILRSPSILAHEGRSNFAGGSEVISVKSSGSSSNKDSVVNSDVESPLIIKSDRYKEHIDEDLEIVDWKLAKSRNKKSFTDSQSSLSLSTKRTSLRSSQQSDKFKKPGKDFVGKARKYSPKGSHQTTLTQGFFSPKKKMSKTKSLEDGGQRKSGRINSNSEGSVLRELKDQSGNVGGEGRLNGSLDPSAELSQWCQDPGTLPSLDTDFCEADLQSDSSQPKTSTLAVEDTQDIPCSSTSYKFLPKKHRKKDIENIDPRRADVNIDDSFDRLPKTKGSDVAHVAVVRKRDERQKLPGHSCKECLQYYKSAGRSDEEIKQHMHQCSRHRAQYVPPDTPPHFWSIGFIETQENDNTVLKEDNDGFDDDPDVPTYRRRKRLNKYFRSKNENSVLEDDVQNTQ